MKNIFQGIKADTRLLIVAVFIVVLLGAGGFYGYYNSQERVIERLVRKNPRGEEFARSIAQANEILDSSGLSAKERIDALLSRAVAREALGDKKGALDDYKDIIELNAAHPIARSNLAGVYTSLGKYSDAEYQYLALIATQPKTFDGYTRLADLYLGYYKEKENLAPAVLLYALEQNGKQPIFLEKLAQYYFDRGLYVQATEQINELLIIDPNNEFAQALLNEIQEKS